MGSSPIVLTGEKQSDIEALARYIEAHIAENWEAILKQNSGKLLDAYDRAGDMAYGTYLNLLFLPVHRELRQLRLRPKPQLPGEFEISREWGTDDQTNQQRWMWSTIYSSAGESLGTIVTIVHHDHTQFRIPRQPQVIALTETGSEAVVEALSRRSTDFKNAREAKIEIEEYLRGLESQ